MQIDLQANLTKLIVYPYERDAGFIKKFDCIFRDNSF